MEKYILMRENKFLTNHGMNKFWFVASFELAFIFDTLKQAEIMAENYKAQVIKVKVENNKIKF
jgi:hypothetical protein